MDIVARRNSHEEAPHRGGTLKAMARFLSRGTTKATGTLARCLFDRKTLAPPKRPPLCCTVTIQSVGSKVRIGTFDNCPNQNPLSYLLHQLFSKTLGKPGETFVVYRFCVPGDQDQDKSKLYKELDTSRQIGSLAGEGETLTLELLAKTASDGEKILFVHQALKRELSKDQLLRILEIIEQIEDKNLRANTLLEGIENFDIFLQSPYLEKILEGLEQMPCSKDGLLYNLANKFFRRGDLQQAQNLAMRFTNRRYGGQYLNAIVEAYIKKGSLEEGLKLAEKITNLFYKNEALEALAKAYFEQGNLEKAQDLALKLPDHNHTKKTLLEKIVQAFITKNKLLKAHTTANLMPDDGFYKNIALQAIATAYGQQGNKEKQLELLKEMT